ncbi:LysR family transcriptional regulator [Bacillus aerolatus]|uniref:LysR family transcriptional regulator n=1 Tax=Bacillus aerolatus TaxID=2653354 RepID=A0A6I1FMM9_9BACI|nr:LysR family transcriptional regulator [Bacillus aerolatus]KAB7708263.1 LysR family transcriptional regulator [Bacillus aerolatus]
MEIRHLKTFKTIVEVGSFNRTAQQLNFAQSTITAHIKAIEEELGFPLFDRIGKKVFLTDIGKAFLPYATDMLNLFNQSKEYAVEASTISGSLVIGATESLTVYRLPSIISEYTRKYPNVDISLKTADGKLLRDYLRTGEIDIALLLEIEKKETSELNIMKLTNEQMVLIEPLPDQLEAINKNTVLFTGQGCNYRILFEKYLFEKDIPIKAIYELGSIEAIKQCVINGLGISLLPLITVKTEIEQGKLKATPWETKNSSIATSLAHHKNKWISPAIRAAIDIIKCHTCSLNTED